MLDIEDAQIKLKVPRIFREVAKQEAKKSRRTLNREVTIQLERAYAKEIQEFRNQAEVAGGLK